MALTNLEVLKADVEHFASLCLPDLTYTIDEDLAFVSIAMGKIYDDPLIPPIAGLRITNKALKEDAPREYLFNEWSRAQLLTMLGTKEKWFQLVSMEMQVEELQRRRHALQGAVFRTMKGVDEDEMPLRVVRGMVSRHFADIPDTEIVSALLDVMPDGQYAKDLSGKTDRALYAYAVTKAKIAIPGTRFEGYPGVLLKNSEVGYTSLWVMPTLYSIEQRRAVVLEKQSLLRQIHRGNAGDLRVRFREALERASAVWAGLSQKMTSLARKTYPDAASAIEAMRSVLESCGATAAFARRCELTYQSSAGTRKHTAADIFEVIVEESAATGLSKDRVFERSAIAGAVLLRLTL